MASALSHFLQRMRVRGVTSLTHRCDTNGSIHCIDAAVARPITVGAATPLKTRSGVAPECRRMQLGGQRWRGMHFWQVFSKEATEQRQKKLREELQRGYFDDMKDLRDTGGRVGPPAEVLTAPLESPDFPRMEDCVGVDGSPCELPVAGQATLITLAFRSGAQDHIDEWMKALDTFEDGGLEVVELGLIDSYVMGVFPFRQSILANAKTRQQQTGVKQIFRFGDAEPIRTKMNLHNKLAAFVFLVDAAGRVRWRASGPPEPGEVDILARCARDVQKTVSETSRVSIHVNS